MSEPGAAASEVDLLFALVRERYGGRLSPDELDAVRTALAGIVEGAGHSGRCGSTTPTARSFLSCPRLLPRRDAQPRLSPPAGARGPHADARISPVASR